MNIKIGLLTMERNWYLWESQQIIGRLDFQKLHRYIENQKLKNLFYIIFRILGCAIRMVPSKIVLQITNDNASKLTRFISVEKAVINDVKKPGL